MKHKIPLTKQNRLIALGLFTLARQHYVQLHAAEEALADLLGFEESYAGCISDQIYGDGDFEKGMKKENL